MATRASGTFDSRLGKLALWAVATALTVAVLAGIEMSLWGWHPAREVPPRWSAYHLFRSAVALAAAGTLVSLAAREHPRDHPALFKGEQRLAAGVTALAIALTLLLPVSPGLYHRLAQEDTALEWASALLLLGASLLFLRHAWRQMDRRAPLTLAAAAGLALLLFVMGMEEVSWMQRLFGFATPEAVAEVNWQSEFNVHNLNTDLFELVFYSATGFALLLLPLLAETVRLPRALAWMAPFLPTRAVAAVSAPVAMFTYGHWNLLPIQLIELAAPMAMVAYALTARSPAERRLFGALAAAIVAGQVAMLATGRLMPDLPDATEYKELFIAFGLAFYAWSVSARRSAPSAS